MTDDLGDMWKEMHLVIIDLFMSGNRTFDRQDRQISNIKTRSRNHGGRGKEISITCTECVSLALVIQHAKRMRCIAICGLYDSTIFFHIIT